MRHHRRAEDADRDVEHRRVGEDLGRRDEAGADAPRSWRAASHSSTANDAGDRDDQRDDQRLDVAEAPVLQEQDDQHVERGEADAPDERQAEEQVERDRRAEHLGEVAGGDGDLAEDPQDDGDRPRVVVAAGLREVAAGGDAERAASACSRIAIRFESRMTLSSV